MNILAPVAFILVPLVHYFLFYTKPGLRLMSAGENPKAAESVGIPVSLYRYCAVIASGMLASRPCLRYPWPLHYAPVLRGSGLRLC